MGAGRGRCRNDEMKLIDLLFYVIVSLTETAAAQDDNK